MCICVHVYICSHTQDPVVGEGKLRYPVIRVCTNVYMYVCIYLSTCIESCSRRGLITLSNPSRMCVCIYVYIPSHIQDPVVEEGKLRYPVICVYINVYMNVCIYLSTCIESCSRRGQSFAYVYMYICIYLFTYTGPCSRRGQTTLPSHTRMYKCIYVCMYIFIHMHSIL